MRQKARLVFIVAAAAIAVFAGVSVALMTQESPRQSLLPQVSSSLVQSTIPIPGDRPIGVTNNTRPVVLDPSITVPPDASGCPTGPDVAKCLETWALKNLEAHPDEVLSLLTSRSVDDPVFSEYACHDTWHAVGAEAAKLFDLNSLFEHWAYSCFGGLLHGALQVVAPRLGVEGFTLQVGELCRSYEDRPPVVYLDCWHGAGHGFSALLPFPDSMSACSGLGLSGEELEWCTWGAAESMGSDFLNKPAYKKELLPRLGTLCDGLDVGRTACLRIQAPLLASEGLSTDELLDRCSSSSDPQTCAFATGQVVGVNWSLGNQEPSACEHVKNLSVACASGAGKSVGRSDELGGLVNSPRHDVSVKGPLSICPFYSGSMKQGCTEAETSIRAIELSPSDARTLTLTWWDDHPQPTTPFVVAT